MGLGATEVGERVMAERRRLGVQDALWLEMDKPGNLMVVDSLFWTATPIDWDQYLDATKQRLWDRYPVFRSVVVRGEDDSWYWEEQPDADLAARYDKVVLPEPGGDAELQALIASERTTPLDRSEPLWRAVLVDGFHGGSAVLFRGHHAIADGIRMVQLALSVFDASPDGAAVAAVPAGELSVVPEPRRTAPSAPRSPLTSQVRSAATSTVRASLQLARSTVTNPVGAAGTALTLSESVLGSMASRARSVVPSARGGPLGLPSFVSAVPGDVDTARKLVLGTRNDNTRWTGTVGDHKAVAWSPPLSLDDVKAVAHANGATVNDVLVTCVAESLRSYLLAQHAVCHTVTWDVPVNLKPFDPTLPLVLGNSFALVQLELPTNIEDPVRTLEVVRHRMGRIKRGHGSRGLRRAGGDLADEQAAVPGDDRPAREPCRRSAHQRAWPPDPALRRGAEGRGDDGLGASHGRPGHERHDLRYDGKVFVGIAADAGLVPGHERIVDGFARAFRRLSLRTT